MDELRQTYETFTDCWKAYKGLYPVQSLTNDEYWRRAVTVLNDVREKHPTKLCEEILRAVKAELERMAG